MGHLNCFAAVFRSEKWRKKGVSDTCTAEAMWQQGTGSGQTLCSVVPIFKASAPVPGDRPRLLEAVARSNCFDRSASAMEAFKTSRDALQQGGSRWAKRSLRGQHARGCESVVGQIRGEGHAIGGMAI